MMGAEPGSGGEFDETEAMRVRAGARTRGTIGVIVAFTATVTVTLTLISLSPMYPIDTESITSAWNIDISGWDPSI